MKKLCIVVLSFAAAVSAVAQTKTVTNDDLEKFRQQRLESERKLREKYAAMGTTPEEVEKQYRRRRAEMEQYSDQLRRERIERENIIRANAFYDQLDAAQVNPGGTFFYPNFVYAYSYPFFGLHGRNFVFRRLRNLPPNMRTVQEYAIMYPNTPGFNRQFTGRTRFGGGIRIGGGVRLGGGRGFVGGGFITPGRPRR
jgi:hypothetical protein